MNARHALGKGHAHATLYVVNAPTADVDEQGVDLSVIRWFLGLTVEDRLAHADEWREASVRMMQAFDEQHRSNPRPTR